MSQAPDQALDEITISELERSYALSLVRLDKMLRAGVSWSGRERNCCFLNTRNQPFANVSAVTGLDFIDDARGLGLVDWDHDGDLDLWCTNRSAPRVRFVRNDMATDAAIQVKLIGRNCNRDAIGARLEAELPGEEKLLKTVRAGEGFIGQSTKWVHFGLGKSQAVKRLAIRWPGGSEEAFNDLKPGRYQVTQGENRIERLPLPSQQSAIQPSNQPELDQGGARLTRLTHPFPLPSLRYLDTDWNQVLINPAGAPLVINLWASWCQPCAGELTEFSREHDRFAELGARVLALSVDGIELANVAERQASDQTKSAQQMAAALRLPFSSGYATQALVEKLTTTVNFVYHSERSLPVPTTVLLDARGHLAAVYRGRVAAERICDDIRALDLSRQELLRESLPFAGKWLDRPPTPRLITLAIATLELGYLDDVMGFIRDNEAELSTDPKYPKLLTAVGLELASQGRLDDASEKFQQTLRQDPRHAEAHRGLADVYRQEKNLSLAAHHLEQALASMPDDAAVANELGELRAAQRKSNLAVTALQRAVRIDANFARAHINLARLYLEERRPSDAVPHLEQAIRLRPDDAQLRNNLGAILAQQGQSQLAAEHFLKALELKPDFVDAFCNLARLRTEQGQDQDAARHFRRALQIDHDSRIAALGLAWLLATSSDESIRDAKEAVAIAARWAEVTGGRDPLVLDRLAAAYAAGQQFPRAIETAKRAIELARQSQNSRQVKQIELRLKLYQKNQPYRRGASS